MQPERLHLSAHPTFTMDLKAKNVQSDSVETDIFPWRFQGMYIVL